MRHTTLLAFAFSLVSSAALAAQPELALSTPESASAAGGKVSYKKVYADLQAVSGESPIVSGVTLGDRYFEKNRDVVRSFLIDRMKSLGLEVSLEHFELDHDRENVEKTPYNIIAELKGSERPNEVLEVVSHYDTIFPGVKGADDNGSGLVTVLETARVLSGLKPKRTVRFVFTDLEEPDLEHRCLHGATAHVLGLKDRGEKLLGAVVVDMIGYHPAEGPQHVDFEVGTLASNRALGEAFFAQHAAYADRAAKLDVLTKDAKPTWGEHGAYWTHGQPALFVSEDFDNFNPHYHHPKDTMAMISDGYFKSVVRSVIEGVARIAGVEVASRGGSHAPTVVPDLRKFERMNRAALKPSDRTDVFLRAIGRPVRLK